LRIVALHRQVIGQNTFDHPDRQSHSIRTRIARLTPRRR
jgi:hypothetical protein